MTLSEFDRRCRGYHRRHAAKVKPMRLLATILLNVNRAEGEPALAPEEVTWLYGDPLPEVPQVLSAAEVEAEFARVAALDKDLF